MTEPIGKALDELLRDAYEKLSAEQPADAWVISPETELHVRKAQAWMPVTCCVLTDTTGVNHCEHPVPPRPSRHRRLRWRIRSGWSALRMRAGSWIAGVDLNREDW